MIVIDPAFVDAGQKSGLEVWRIEKMKIVTQELSTYGQFFTGDSYIILHTEQHSNNSFEWNIHFWLGSETSIDEQGVAAYKTVELDDHLGGFPVQHREVQDHESKLFLSYFKKGIKYLKGGVESGFKHVDTKEFETHLFQVKGKRHVRARQIDCNLQNLNLGDVFILDTGLIIYLWIGPQSSRMEKVKGIEMARSVRDEERGGRAQILVIDDNHLSHEEFFKALGWKGEQIHIPDSQVEDMEYERSLQHEVKLFKISDASGVMEILEINDRPLQKALLDTKDCFILDTGRSGVFAWVGKECTKEEKSTAIKKALEFVKLHNYPNWTPITRLSEGNETTLFKQYFSQWPEVVPEVCSPGGLKSKSFSKLSPPKFDVKTLHNSTQKHSKTLPDDGRGDVQIWRIQSFEMVEVDGKLHGIFYSGDSYVILYSYRIHGRDNYIIYFWQGNSSTADEKAASAILAMRLDDEVTLGRAVQVRVVQGKEPEHFLQIFQGRMIILMGGHASGFCNSQDTDSFDSDGVRLFHVKGTNDLNTKAVQVKEKAMSLNSNDVFVLETPGIIYVWKGQGANQLERVMAKSVAERICQAQRILLIDEGDEPGDFWASLGGKGEYASIHRLNLMRSISNQGHDSDSIFLPRLFQCSNASGRFYLEEILNFDQEDLIEDDVMLLDAMNEIFIWIGIGANAEEKTEAMKAAQEYVRTDPSSRSLEDVVFITVKQGHEPISFTAYFHGWNSEKKSNIVPYEDLKKEIKQVNEHILQSQKTCNSPIPEEITLKSSKETPLSPNSPKTFPQSPPPEKIKLKSTKEIKSPTNEPTSATFERPSLKHVSKLEEKHDSEYKTFFIEKPVLKSVSSPAKFDNETEHEEISSKRFEKPCLQSIPTTPKSPSGIAPGNPWKTFTLQELQQLRPPEGVDITRKESYLSDEDFLAVFLLTKKEFYQFPAWKQQSIKKKLGLF